MVGNPKYSLGDNVKFSLGSKTFTGKIYIIDKFGTFEDNSEVSYDILDRDGCLYKHIREDMIIEGI